MRPSEESGADAMAAGRATGQSADGGRGGGDGDGGRAHAAVQGEGLARRDGGIDEAASTRREDAVGTTTGGGKDDGGLPFSPFSPPSPSSPSSPSRSPSSPSNLRPPSSGHPRPTASTPSDRPQPSSSSHPSHQPPPPSSAASSSTATARPKRGALLGPDGLLQPFRLLRVDARNFRARWPSDWRSFNQLVLASAVYVFFTNILPGITFASDLDKLTGGTWGTIEVVLSTGVCGVIFSLLSAQPLTILGVTGPFSVLAENIYHLCTTVFDVPFLPVMTWSLIHAAWMHYLLAIFNAHDWTMLYVTNFSADVFSLLNSVIYFYKAVLELDRTRTAVSYAAFLYAVIGAAGTCLLAILLSTATNWAPLLHRYVRLGLAEYAAAISIVIFVAIPHANADLRALDHEQLAVQTSFRPTDPSRSVFFVRFWELPVGWVFGSMVPAAIITALFFFDHEISSIICTVDRYGVRKPGGYAWDIVLLGTTTAMCGILGIPPANGLLPQAPLHSESLIHTFYEEGPVESEKDHVAAGTDASNKTAMATTATAATTTTNPTSHPTALHAVRRVIEQRYSSFLQAALILAFVSPPLQRLLGLTPTSVLAGLFIFMGYQSLTSNPLLVRIGHLVTPPSELPPLPAGVSWLSVHLFTVTQLVVTGLVFGVTLTVAAPAFPVIIVALVPARLLIMNRVWPRATLRFVDGWACREGTPEDNVEGDTEDGVEVLGVGEKQQPPNEGGVLHDTGSAARQESHC